MTALGTQLANQDEIYLCAAKRYYAYFTGINVDIGDVGDPAAGLTLSARDTLHRQTVIDLGLSLKAHQSLRQLIEEILELPHYRESDFGLTE